MPEEVLSARILRIILKMMLLGTIYIFVILSQLPVVSANAEEEKGKYSHVG